jgi:hypothetical protein
MFVSRLGVLQLVASLQIVVTCLAVNGLATEWDGGGSDDKWSTAQNWDTNTVPSTTDAVLIQGTGVHASVEAPATAYNLRVGDNAVLDVSSTIDLTQNLFWGTSPTPGTINVNSGGTINVPFAGYIDANGGMLNINAGGVVNVEGLNPSTSDSVYLSYGTTQTSGIAINGGTLDVSGDMRVGTGGVGTLSLDNGGILNSQFGGLFLGSAGGGFADGTFDLIDGTATFAGHVFVGNGGVGLLNISGGSLTTTNDLFLAYHGTSNGTINLYGGTLSVVGFQIGTAGGTGLVNIEGGTMILSGDQTSLINGYINDGRVVGYTGSGTVEVNLQGGDTVLTAIAGSSPGDFDGDDDVDGIDFLLWQTGNSPDPYSQDDLSDWETYYGTQPLVATTFPVPEPSSLIVVIGLSVLATSSRTCFRGFV